MPWVTMSTPVHCSALVGARPCRHNRPVKLTLGNELGGEAPVELPASSLVRHVVALGASGSGKTVFCKALVEEAVLAGIPAICVDPQGDLCSLALAGGPLADAAEVVIFTPASTRGVPICADPLVGSLESLAPDERMQALSRMAQMVVSLLGFDLAADDGAGLAAVFDLALTELADAGATMELAALTEQMRDPDPARLARYHELVPARVLTTARQRLARLDVGARRLLFHHGVPVDVDLLLGGGAVPAADGRTRVSVVYLNSLHTQEDKELFVAVIADRLYRWMLDHPSERAQALFYVDEIAPFVPPVRKPACKETLALLFKQARKYGVSCLMATQNPGDVDYKAIAQFGTWAVGRLTVRQDLKKIEPALRALAPNEVDAITAALPARGPGEMTLLSPDSFDRAIPLATRRLWSEHRTLDEDAIAELTDGAVRDRFAGLIGDRPAARGAATAPAAPEPPTAPTAPLPEAPTAPLPEAPTAPPKQAADDPLAGPERALARRSKMTARELAEAIGCGDRKARRLLEELVGAGRARKYKDGRANAYFAVASGARPDLGLGKNVAVVIPAVDADQVADLARGHIRSRLFGLAGDRETYDRAELIYRPLYQVEVEESVPRGVLARMVGAGPDQVRGTIYLHPSTLHVLTFTRKDGIAFDPKPTDRATAIDDLDGSATFDDRPPGDLPIDEPAWHARVAPARAKAHARDLFAARVRKLAPLFVPLWQLFLRDATGATVRIVTIDALVGRPVSWPGTVITS
jgi:hypothetical protein